MQATNPLPNDRSLVSLPPPMVAGVAGPARPPPPVASQNPKLPASIERPGHSRGKSRGKTRSPVPHPDAAAPLAEESKGQPVAPHNAAAKTQANSIYGVKPQPPVRKHRKKHAAPKVDAETGPATQFVGEEHNKHREKSQKRRADKAEEGTEAQGKPKQALESTYGIAQGQLHAELAAAKKARHHRHHKSNKRGGGVDADTEAAAAKEKAKVDEAEPGKAAGDAAAGEEQPIQKAVEAKVEAEAVAETEEKPAEQHHHRHHGAKSNKPDMADAGAENGVFPTGEVNTATAAAPPAHAGVEPPKVEPLSEEVKPNLGEDHGADSAAIQLKPAEETKPESLPAVQAQAEIPAPPVADPVQPEPARQQSPAVELQPDAIRSVPPEAPNAKSASEPAEPPEDKKPTIAQPEATVPEDKKEAAPTEKVIEEAANATTEQKQPPPTIVVVSSAAPSSPVAVPGKSTDGCVSVPASAAVSPPGETVQDGVESPASTKPKNTHSHRHHKSSRQPLSGIVPVPVSVPLPDVSPPTIADLAASPPPIQETALRSGDSREIELTLKVRVSVAASQLTPNRVELPPDTAGPDANAENEAATDTRKPAAETVLLVSPAEEIKQYTPTVTDLAAVPNNNNCETTKTGAVAPIEEKPKHEEEQQQEEEQKAELARKNEDTEYESGSWSSEDPDEKSQQPSPLPVQDTQPTCRTIVGKSDPEEPKPMVNILYSKVMLALVVANLVVVVALACFVAYSFAYLKGTGDRMRDVRASGPRRLLEVKNASASVGQMFTATNSNLSSTVDSWGSVWDFEGTMARLKDINESSELVHNESADIYTLVAKKVDAEMLALPTMIESYATTIETNLDTLALSVDEAIDLIPNMLYLVGCIGARLPGIDSTVKSASTAFSAFSTTMQNYLSNTLPQTYYMNKFLSLTTFLFYSKSLTSAPPAKKVAIISMSSSYVYLHSLIVPSLFPGVTFDPLIYTTDTATGWQYALPSYNAVMFDFADTYLTTAGFATSAQKSLVAFMDRGGSVMFTHGTLPSKAITWDSDLYKYCGTGTTTRTTAYPTSSVDLNTAKACHQIIAYPNDLTTKNPLAVSPTHSEPWAATTATQLYGFNALVDTYLTARTNGTQRCAVTEAGHTYAFASDEKALYNNVGYWMLYSHYGGN